MNKLPPGLVIPNAANAHIAGIGTDICDIQRIELALQKHGPRFAQKILGDQELAKYTARAAKVPARGVRFLATRFAAKEAFAKAIGLGIHMPMTWRAVQVLNAPSGAPQIVLNESLGTWYQERFGAAHVTLTDEAQYAIAFVVVEKLS